MKRPGHISLAASTPKYALHLYLHSVAIYSSIQVHQFQSFPVPLSIRALYLPCADVHVHNVLTCYAGNAGGILHLGHEMKAYFWPVDGKGNLLPEHGFQASYEVHKYSTWVKQPSPPPPPHF